MNRFAFCLTLLCVAFVALAPAQTVTQLWKVDGGASPRFPASGDVYRGAAYNPATDHYIVVSRAITARPYVLSGSTGALLDSLNVTGVSGGTFALNDVEVTTNGVIYAANLATQTGSDTVYKIYRWANETSAPKLVYAGRPGTARMGDVLDVAGTGASTTIYATGNAATSVIHRFTTTTGDTFALGSAIPIIGQEAGAGIAQVTPGGNAYISRFAGGNAIDLVDTLGVVLGSISSLVSGSSTADIHYFTVGGRNFLAVGPAGSTSHDPAVVIDVTAGPGAASVVGYSGDLGANANSNATGDVDVKVGPGGSITLFVLVGNNGFAAYTMTGFLPFDDPQSLAVKNSYGAITLDGKLNEGEWSSAPTLLYGNGAWKYRQPGELTVTGAFDIKATYDYNANNVNYGTFRLPDRDSTLSRVKFLRKGTNLYIGLTTNDKSICKFDWEGDGLFVKFKTATGAEKEYKLYYQNPNDTIRYEEPAKGWGSGYGYLSPGSKVNDTTQVDNGFSAELVIKLDSLGYTPGLSSIQLALVKFDPNGYQHPMNSYDTLHGTFYKSWWGSEWGGVWRNLNFTPELTRFDNPDTMLAKKAAAITLDGQLSEPEWAAAPTLLFGNGAFLKKQGSEKTVTGEFDIKATYDYIANNVNYGTFRLPDRDSTLTRVKFLRSGMNLYVGFTSDDKSICKFDWEGDGVFLKVKTPSAAEKEYKLYWQNLNDTIRYEGPATNWGSGYGYLNSGSKVNDTSGVDKGYSAELMVRLDSLGYGSTSGSMLLSLTVFDPNGYKHPMNSYDTLRGTYYKSWWGSEWGGVWKTVRLESLTDVQGTATGEVPTVFALMQNFPNPFNPSTTIRFDVPVQSKVTVVLYDITGREVRTLVNGDFAPGAYTTLFDARGLASGVYMYRMMTTPGTGEAFVSTRKLVLLK